VDRDEDGVVLSSELVYQAMGWDEEQAFQMLGAEESFQKFVDPDDLGAATRDAFVAQMSQRPELCATLASASRRNEHVLFCCTFQQFEDTIDSVDRSGGDSADSLALLEREGGRGGEGERLLARLALTLVPRRAVELCGGGSGGSGGDGGSDSAEMATCKAQLKDAQDLTKALQMKLEAERSAGRLALAAANEKHAQAIAKHDVRSRTTAEVNQRKVKQLSCALMAEHTMKDIVYHAVHNATSHEVEKKLRGQIYAQIHNDSGPVAHQLKEARELLRAYEQESAVQRSEQQLVEGMVKKLTDENQQLEEAGQLKEEALEEVAASSRTQLGLLQEVMYQMLFITPPFSWCAVYHTSLQLVCCLSNLPSAGVLFITPSLQLVCCLSHLPSAGVLFITPPFSWCAVYHTSLQLVCCLSHLPSPSLPLVRAIFLTLTTHSLPIPRTPPLPSHITPFLPSHITLAGGGRVALQVHEYLHTEGRTWRWV
jgi:hypothetical protein